MRSPERSCRPAPISPSTSVSISNCTTASATLRRKSPSPALASSSASGNVSSVIGSSWHRGEASQLHLNQPIRWPPPPTPSSLEIFHHDRGRYRLVRRRSQDRAEEQDHPSLGQTRHATGRANRSAYR